MTGAEIIIKALRDQGVDTVFGYPGGAVLPIYDAIFKQNDIRHILVRQEGGAVHAAEGYARSTGKVGVVLVTSGPGATNAVTGLTDALLDSIPIVCLTGQVPTHLIGNDAFQECDTTGITRPCTKHNYLVKNVDQMARVMHEAFHIAGNGRPGPVVIDIPKDVQMAQGEYVPPSMVEHPTYQPKTVGDADAVARAVELMADAERPLFYTGGGMINSGTRACETLRKLVKLTGYPITSTLMGLGAYPSNDQQYLGMVGMHGSYESNLSMYNCDVMINIGARFDDRVTGKLSEFSPNSKKIHVDIDASSINKTVVVDVPIIGDAGTVLEQMLKLWQEKKHKANKQALDKWWAQINQWRAKKCFSYKPSDKIIKPQYALERLRDLTRGKDAYFTTEVGQHQMWAAQFLELNEPHRWMTSGGLGTMGYGLPAAIGVQLAHPDKLVVDVAGEASILMNIQEMSTAVQHNLPIKVFILNNQWMGMVRQWQELIHGGRYSQSYTAALPDFVKLAEAFGGIGLRAETPAELDGVIKEMMKTDKPTIVDVCVDEKENCFPMIPGGRAHYEMILGPDQDISTATPDEGLVLV
ncbi:MAG TPA: acetolactate synthase 3 large subunit [Alphaproteobacteria bacterium]|nr:acetolactate synthase 3 large subunit [Alphaproteobacteria bacterium]